MHKFETLLVNQLSKGVKPRLNEFPISELLGASAELGRSPMFAEFVRIAAEALDNGDPMERNLVGRFIVGCIESATHDLGWSEALDVLDQHRPLPEDGDERCFQRFLVLIRNDTLPAVTRTVALDGALRWAISEPQRRFQLLHSLLEVQVDDDVVFLSHVAKIAGIAYSHWREPELLARLRELVAVDGVRDEAAYELAMAYVAAGLEAENRGEAQLQWTSASYWFNLSSQNREHRPDATIYGICLTILTTFSAGTSAAALQSTCASLKQESFAWEAWHQSLSDPPWLGARSTEAACWTTLAMKLTELSAYLEQASWWEPAVVVEDCLLAAYTANRTILRLASGGGITSLVRPAIVSRLSRNEGQAYQLKEWIRRNSEHEFAGVGQELLEAVNALIASPETIPPSDAAPVWPDLAAILQRANLPATTYQRACEVILDAQAISIGSMTSSEASLLEEVSNAMQNNQDYAHNRIGRQLFHSVLLASLRFLQSRLEMTKKDDPGVAYLFEQKDGNLSTEGELQADYHRFMLAAVPSVEIEVGNIGGGRVDVRFRYGAERVVTEVKREAGDCAFERLRELYGAQTTDYQNVSLRFGFLLVLDQSEKRLSGTPHIRTLVKAVPVVRKGESEVRMIVIMKVPGRRLVPSHLSKAARTTRRHPKT